jgi:hypothetical protein
VTSHIPIGPRITPPPVPSREEQIAVLNRALSDEVLRHARTRLELESALEWCQLLQSVDVKAEAAGDE